MKTALTIAGSDCSGGAGIQADIKTMSALGVYGMSVITSVVAENTCRVITSHQVPVEIISAQLDAVFEDIEVNAVKVGMLPSKMCMEVVAAKLKQYSPQHIVVDPVMNAKDGSSLMSSSGDFARLILPYATLLTPNIPEAEKLTGKRIECLADMKDAAQILVKMGAKAVLIKGGHSQGDAEDVLFDGQKFFTFSHERIETKNTHGTGCTLSSAIAAYLALGFSLVQAVEKAKEYITGAIKNALEIGKGHGPTHHFYMYYDKKEKKHIDYSLYLCTDRNLMSCATIEECVESALRGGVTVVQLREKDVSSKEFYYLGLKIKEITKKYNVPLIINDRVDIALAIGADGVHLGQSDLDCAAVRKLCPNMIIGVTAHNKEEAVRAMCAGADYLGVGAMRSTSTKSDAKVISPNEFAAIREAVNLPIVAIGGINKDNVTQFKGMGIDGIAVVSAIVAQSDIESAARELFNLWKR